MNIKGKVSNFTRQMFVRQYIPAIISAIVFAIADMADALVVGNRMGTLGLAAIAFSIPVYMFFNVIMHSFGMGGSIMYARRMAEGDEQKAVRSFQGVFTVLMVISIAIAVFGNVFIDKVLFILGASASGDSLKEAARTYLQLILTAAPFFFFDYSLGYYLRNDDMEKEASICSTIGNITDFSLNIILVLFLNLGVFGAGLATFIGVVLTSCIQLVFLLQKKSHLRLYPFRPGFSDVWKSFKTGLSSCISYIYSFVFIWIGNNAMVRLAGETGVAIFDIIQNLSNLMIYIFGALNQATQPILSTYEGECNYKECDSMQARALVIAAGNSILYTVLVCIFAPWICRLFGIHMNYAIAMGVYAIRVFSLCIIFVGLNMVIANYYTSRSIFVPAFILSTLRGVAIILPVTFICIAIGKDAFWFVYPITEAVSLLIIFVYISFIMKKTKRLEPERVFTATLFNEPEKIGNVTEQIDSFCEKWEANVKQQYYVQMTVEEMCSAIMAKGFSRKMLVPGEIQLTVVASDKGEFTLHIRDNATTFDPFSMEKAVLNDDDDSETDFNALGMDVIKQKAKSFYYRRYQGFNTMVVKI